MIVDDKELFAKIGRTVSDLKRAGMEQEALDLENALRSSNVGLVVLKVLRAPLHRLDKSRLPKQAAEDVESEISYLDAFWDRVLAHRRNLEYHTYRAATLFSRATVCVKGLVSISDTKLGEYPGDMGTTDFASGTDTCILVQTRLPVDGATTFELTNDEREFGGREGVREFFKRELCTPSRCIHLFTGEWTSILNLPICERTLVRVWGNTEREPSWIGVLATGLEP